MRDSNGRRKTSGFLREKIVIREEISRFSWLRDHIKQRIALRIVKQAGYIRVSALADGCLI
jgi:hypothetical protein